jgi:hypothetical protein
MGNLLLIFTLGWIVGGIGSMLGIGGGVLLIPFVIYGIFRYLYIIHVQGNGGAPDEVLLTDRPLQISIILFGLTVIAILYWL